MRDKRNMTIDEMMKQRERKLQGGLGLSRRVLDPSSPEKKGIISNGVNFNTHSLNEMFDLSYQHFATFEINETTAPLSC